MGAWGIGIFENDDAMDWLGEFSESPSIAGLRNPIDEILNNTDYIEAPDASIALAAAATIAAIKGKPSAAFPDDFEIPELEIDNGLIDDAIIAMRKISEDPDSELKQLWEESEESMGWHNTIFSLAGNLEKSKSL
ncbi:MAG: DUF4259 domain-containing protein [Gemmatimonadaceae bacterium]|nr:DUF4259 domain-containing protein [Chitinophagaceae bacterium]